MAAGAKPSPRGEAKGCAGVKVDISRQKAIIPAKVFLKFPTRFSPFIGLIHTIFAIFRRKVRPPQTQMLHHQLRSVYKELHADRETGC